MCDAQLHFGQLARTETSSHYESSFPRRWPQEAAPPPPLPGSRACRVAVEDLSSPSEPLEWKWGVCARGVLSLWRAGEGPHTTALGALGASYRLAALTRDTACVVLERGFTGCEAAVLTLLSHQGRLAVKWQYMPFSLPASPAALVTLPGGWVFYLSARGRCMLLSVMLVVTRLPPLLRLEGLPSACAAGLTVYVTCGRHSWRLDLSRGEADRRWIRWAGGWTRSLSGHFSVYRRGRILMTGGSLGWRVWALSLRDGVCRCLTEGPGGAAAGWSVDGGSVVWRGGRLWLPCPGRRRPSYSFDPASGEWSQGGLDAELDEPWVHKRGSCSRREGEETLAEPLPREALGGDPLNDPLIPAVVEEEEETPPGEEEEEYPMSRAFISLLERSWDRGPLAIRVVSTNGEAGWGHWP